MARVRPLYYNRNFGALQEMTDEQIDTVAKWILSGYGANPSARLAVSSVNNGNLSTMVDTRVTASPHVTGTISFPTPASLGSVSVEYNRITFTSQSLAEPANSDGTDYPVYYQRGSRAIRAMSADDMFDTFIGSALTLIQNGSITPYRVHDGNSLSGGYSLVSNNPIFVDTIANAGAYQNSSIPEALDQPTIAKRYWLHKFDSISDSIVDGFRPLFITTNKNLKEYSLSELQSKVVPFFNFIFSNTEGSRIEYSIGTNLSGYRALGTGIVNTRLGSNKIGQVKVTGNDYRAQRFPAGSQVTISTYYLRARTF